MLDSSKPKKTTQPTRRALRGVFIGTLLRILRYPFVVLSLVVIAPLMGSNNYGQYAYYLSIFAILDLFSDLGYQQIFARFTPEFENRNSHVEIRELLFACLASGLAITSLLIIALAGSAFFFPISGFSRQWILILGLHLFFTQLKGILYSFLYGLNHIIQFSSKEVIRSGMTFILVFLMFIYFGLTGALWALVCNEILMTLLAIFWTRKYLLGPIPIMHWKRLWPIMLFGLTFYVPAFILGTFQRLGNIIIKLADLPVDQIAFFDIGNQFTLLMASFLALVLSSLLPTLTHLHLQNDHRAILDWQKRGVIYCCIIFFTIYYTLFIFGKDAVAIVLGPSFTPVIQHARILAVSTIPFLLIHIGINYATIHKQPAIFAKATCAGLLVMISSACLLTPFMQADAASVGTVLGYTTTAAIFVYYYPQELLSIIKGLGSTCAWGVALLPLTLLHSSSVFMSVVLVIGIWSLFLGLLFWKGPLDIIEIQSIWSSIQSRKKMESS